MSDEILTLEEVQIRHVLEVLDQCKGNKSHAAKALGIDRRSVYRWLERANARDVSNTNERPVDSAPYIGSACGPSGLSVDEDRS